MYSIEIFCIAVICAVVQPFYLESVKKSEIHPSNNHAQQKPLTWQNKRIIDGVPMATGEWPWMVSLHLLIESRFTAKTGMKHVCGGTIIKTSPTWILTAAHCLRNREYNVVNARSNMEVAIGEYNQYLRDDKEKLLKIDEIYLHPNYSAVTALNDIALIKLQSEESLVVEDVADLDNGEFSPGQQCSVAGWGQIAYSPYGYGMYIPLMTTVNLTDVASCKSKLKGLPHKFYIDETVVCAGSQEGHDACYGDSGGPLMCMSSHDSRWKLTGIVSAGYKCGTIDYPGIYTRVSHFVPWIHKTISANSTDIPDNFQVIVQWLSEYFL